MAKIHQFFTTNYIFCPQCQTKLVAKNEALVCPSCGFARYDGPFLGTIALITRQPITRQPTPGADREILLTKRRFAPAQGDWDVPGGFIRSQESAEQAVIREVKEETNLTIEIDQYLTSLTGLYDQEPVLDIIFTAHITDVNGGQLQAADDVAEARWFPLDKLPKNIAFPRVKTALQLVAKNSKKEPYDRK